MANTQTKKFQLQKSFPYQSDFFFIFQNLMELRAQKASSGMMFSKKLESVTPIRPAEMNSTKFLIQFNFSFRILDSKVYRLKERTAFNWDLSQHSIAFKICARNFISVLTFARLLRFLKFLDINAVTTGIGEVEEAKILNKH